MIKCTHVNIHLFTALNLFESDKFEDRIMACISRVGAAIGAAAAIERFIFKSQLFL